MPLLLDRREPEPADDRARPGEQEPGHEVDERPGGRGIQPRREGGGDAEEPVGVGDGAISGTIARLVERPVDRPAIALDDIESPAVIAPQIRVPPPRPIRPNGDPPRIVKKRVSKKSRRRIKLVTFK